LNVDERISRAVPVNDAKLGAEIRSSLPQAYYLGKAVAIEVRDPN